MWYVNIGIREIKFFFYNMVEYYQNNRIRLGGQIQNKYIKIVFIYLKQEYIFFVIKKIYEVDYFFYVKCILILWVFLMCNFVNFFYIIEVEIVYL